MMLAEAGRGVGIGRRGTAPAPYHQPVRTERVRRRTPPDEGVEPLEGALRLLDRRAGDLDG